MWYYVGVLLLCLNVAVVLKVNSPKAQININKTQFIIILNTMYVLQSTITSQ